MKFVKRFFIAIGVLVLLFIATAILVPVLFKDKIMALVKKELNENLNAVTDFKDVDISLFHHFPYLSVSIEGLSISGVESFKNDTLIAAKSIDISLDLMKAIKGTYDIRNIGVITPRIHAIIHEDGKTNWDITRPSSENKPASESKPFALKLRKYSIEDAFIEYRDEQGKMHAIISNLAHTGSGDFTSDNFTLATKTTADAITFINGNIPYLSRVKTAIDLDLQVDSRNSKYTFNTDKIQLNGLRLSTKGFVQMPDTNNTIIDVQFNTPSNDFKDILSLVPGIYQGNFKDIKTTGKAKLEGFVKGTYNKKTIPAYHLALEVADGSFQYPDLPQKVSNIQIKLDVNNPDGITDHTVVNLQRAHLDLGAEPFDFRMLLKTPVSNQWIDASAKGRIDLSRMQQFMKLEAGTKLSGVVTADVSVKGSIADAQKKQFDKLDAAGNIGITNLTYASKDYPGGVNIYSLQLSFNPKNVTMSNLRGQYLGTIFAGDGSIDNLLGYYLRNESLSGAFRFTADKVDVNKFMGTSATPSTTATPASAEPFIVPSNLDVSLSLQVGTINYDNITLSGVQGVLSIRDQAVNMQNITGRTLDGTMRIDGSYATKNDKKNPEIHISYSLQNVDVQKTYNTFASLQKILPVGKYVSGKISSTLTMNGKLGADMAPVMSSLSGKGDLMLLSGLLSNFPVTDQLADKLKLSQFKNINLKDMKLFYSFENGRVTIQPYKTKLGDIEAEIAGSHGFDQTLKYGVNLVVPRSMMGAAANDVVNNLVNQAAGRGIPIKVGDKVNLTVNIGGTMTSPKIETNLKNVATDAVNSIKDEIKKEVEHKVDSVKKVVKDTVAAIKNQVVEKAKDEANKAKNDIINQVVNGHKDTTKKSDPVKDVTDKAKDGINNLFKKKK